MRKLELKKEQLTDLSTEDLTQVVGGLASLADARQCAAIAVAGTVKDTQCGPNCTSQGTYPINQCYLTFFCE